MTGADDLDDLLNPNLNTEALSQIYARDRRLQVCDVFRLGAAEEIALELELRVPWRFAIREGEHDKVYDSEDWERLPIAQRQQILKAATRQAGAGFQYMFDYWGLVSAMHARKKDDTILARLTRFLASDRFAAFLREITGCADIVTADAQATRFRAGQYLSRHDDLSRPERRAAYVLNFTRGWRADWGGMLLFHDAQDDVSRGWLPRFNVLNLFAVPQLHSVSFVTPAATAYRHSITGWALARKDDA